MTDPRLWTTSQLMTWVLMPDHWHGLVELGQEDLSRLIGRLKANAARRVREVMCVSSPVWARGFHDRAIRREEDLLDVANYIVHNPVRARLAAAPESYAYWNAVWESE